MEEPSKKNWLYGVIAVLFLALIIESGLLISRIALKKEERKRRTYRAPVIEHYPDTRPAALGHPPSSRPSPAVNSRDQWDSFFEEIERMQKEMNRILNESFGRMARSPALQAPLSSFLRSAPFPSFSPAIDLQETEKAYIAKADLPGLEKDKIQVSVSGNVLAIQGERKEETEKEDSRQGFFASERSYGSFSRSVNLPGPVDESRITADYQKGVLTVTLPKLKGTESAGRKRVPIT